MPIVMPMFDRWGWEITKIGRKSISERALSLIPRRASCSISKSQIGFIEFIIQDMMNAWDGFIDMPELVQYMQYNYTQWKLFEEQGINTLNDIKRKQLSITNASISNMKLDELMWKLMGRWFKSNQLKWMKWDVFCSALSLSWIKSSFDSITLARERNKNHKLNFFCVNVPIIQLEV